MKKTLGFSLIEIIMVMVIVGSISGIAALIITNGSIAYFQAKPIISLADKANLAMTKLLRELQSAESINAIGVDTISFTNQQGDSVVFDVNGTTLEREANSSGANPLCNNVSNITFRYYDQTLNATVAPANVRFISVSLTLSDNNATYPLMSATAIRSLL